MNEDHYLFDLVMEWLGLRNLPIVEPQPHVSADMLRHLLLMLCAKPHEERIQAVRILAGRGSPALAALVWLCYLKRHSIHFCTPILCVTELVFIWLFTPIEVRTKRLITV